MNIWNYLIISLVLLWFIAAFRYIIRVKKQGKSICCGTCTSCSKCNSGKKGK